MNTHTIICIFFCIYIVLLLWRENCYIERWQKKNNCIYILYIYIQILFLTQRIHPPSRETIPCWKDSLFSGIWNPFCSITGEIIFIVFIFACFIVLGLVEWSAAWFISCPLTPAIHILLKILPDNRPEARFPVISAAFISLYKPLLNSHNFLCRHLRPPARWKGGNKSRPYRPPCCSPTSFFLINV